MIIKKLNIVLICLLAGSLLSVSCSDSTSTSNEQSPQLPSAQSMTVDFSTFNQQQNGQNTMQATNSFGRALGTTVILKAVADINLAIPRILLTAAQNSDATLNQDEDWEWNYTHTAEGNTYGVRLVASKQDDNTIQWSFYVTNSQLGLQNQLFFGGTSNIDASQGTWIYYKPGTQEEASQINWSINGDDHATLKLEVLSDQDNYAGDSLKYTFDGSVKHAEYYNAGKDETTVIEWNADTKAGFIIAPDYNDGQQSCWNSNFQDISCTEM